MPSEYRNTMVEYLTESQEMIQQLLSEADFECSFPYIFGNPKEVNAEVSVQSECGLMLRKAQLHIEAVLRANSYNNLHSLAVHMRVILECAAQVVSQASAAHDGTEKSVRKALNALEYDFQSAMFRLARGGISRNEILDMIIVAREGIEEESNESPTKVSIHDKIDFLPSGRDCYDFLSTRFCHSNGVVLAGVSHLGGLSTIDPKANDYTLAILLDYLTSQIVRMLVSYGFLLIAINGDKGPFEESLRLSQLKQEATLPFRTVGGRTYGF